MEARRPLISLIEYLAYPYIDLPINHINLCNICVNVTKSMAHQFVSHGMDDLRRCRERFIYLL